MPIYKRPIGVVLIVLIVTSILLALALKPGHGWGDDFSCYILQGKALVDNNVAETVDIGVTRVAQSTPDFTVGPPSCAWGISVLLAPLIALFGTTLLPLKILNIVFVLISQIAIFYLFYRKLGIAISAMMALMMGLTPYYLELIQAVISDLPFLTFSILSMLMLQRVYQERTYLINQPVDLLLTGTVIFATIFIRSLGLALVVALVVVQFVDLCGRAGVKRPQDLLPSIAALFRKIDPTYFLAWLPLFAGVFLAKLAFPAVESAYAYDDHFVYDGVVGFAKTILFNAFYYADVPDGFFDIPVIGSYVNILLIMPLVLWGAFIRMQQDYIYLVFVAVFMMVLLVFPYQQGVRYMLPVMPFYLYFFFQGVLSFYPWAVGKFSKVPAISHPARLVGVILTVLVCGNFMMRLGLDKVAPQEMQEGPYLATAEEAWFELQQATSTEDSIVFFKPRILPLFADRLGILQLSYEPIVNEAASHVLIYKPGDVNNLNLTLQEIIGMHPEQFSKIWENQDFQLYRVKKDTAL